MSNRADLQSKLENEIMGSENVYFQPPATVKMNYPAIVYNLSKIDNTFANNLSYKRARAYQVILIDKNPDSEYVDKILSLPMCSFDRHYKSDNMNHFVFTLYY